MKNSSALVRRLLAIFALVSLTLLGSAVASTAADAAPYGNMSVTVTFGTNSSGQETVTVTITNGAPLRKYRIELQSTSAVLGFITTNASGNGTGTFVLPAGVSGPQTIVVIDTVTGAATTVAVDVPASGGATPVSSGGSSGGLPNTGAAILGVGVLALAFLAGGGLLLMVGRKRGKAKQAA